MAHHQIPLPFQGGPEHPPRSGEIDREHAIFMEDSLQPWHDRMQELMDSGAHIIAFRGAGSGSGITPTTANQIVYDLYRYIGAIRDTGTPVVLMYDGDTDDRNAPDLGAIFGALADYWRDDPSVVPVAVQTSKWYKPTAPGAALKSATGLPYETYVFNKDMPEIGEELRGRGMAHSALTQSPALVAYDPRVGHLSAGYEQIFVGASGPISAGQLRDLSRKAAVLRDESRPVSVTILAARVNAEQEVQIRARATSHPDEEKRRGAIEKLAQRAAHPYGLLCNQDGTLALNPADYPGIQLKFMQMD